MKEKMTYQEQLKKKLRDLSDSLAELTFKAEQLQDNATLEFESSASRNRYRGCLFQMAADNVGPNHVLLTGTSAIDRWVQFHECQWYAFWTNDADKVTHVIDASAQTATGHILMTGQHTMVGFDDWEAAASGKVWMQGYTNTANVVGIAINPAVS